MKSEKFNEWLRIKGLSDVSIKNYNFYLNKLDFDKLEQDYAVKFLNRYNNVVCKAFLKNLIHFLNVNGHNINIVLPERTGSKKRKLPTIVNINEIRSISKAMNGIRNKLMVYVTYYGGLRISELISIKPYDFLWKKWAEDHKLPCELKITGKGNKQRIVIIPPNIAKRLYFWIKESVSSNQNKEDPLFKIKSRRWQTLLSKASKKAIGRSINPHLLRHSCATYLFENGCSEKEVADYLGHKSTVTTQIYLHLNKKKLFKKVSNVYSLR